MQSGVQDHLNTFWENGNYELILQTLNLQAMEEVGEIWRGGLETWEDILKRESFWYATHSLPSWGCCGREVSSLPQIKQNGLQRDKMEIPLWFSAFCRRQLTGVWDRLEAPKSKTLWLERLALTGGEANDSRMSLFHRSILGHMWKKSWPWTTLDPAHVPGVERAKRDHQRKAARHAGSQELTEKLRARSQSKWILLVLQVSWGLWGQELFRELLMYLMSEGKLYTPASQREPASDCISFCQVRPFSLLPFLSTLSWPQSHLQSCTGERKLTEVKVGEEQGRKLWKSWMYMSKWGRKEILTLNSAVLNFNYKMRHC